MSIRKPPTAMAATRGPEWVSAAVATQAPTVVSRCPPGLTTPSYPEPSTTRNIVVGLWSDQRVILANRARYLNGGRCVRVSPDRGLRGPHRGFRDRFAGGRPAAAAVAPRPDQT